jgi:hypothetical protein
MMAQYLSMTKMVGLDLEFKALIMHQDLNSQQLYLKSHCMVKKEKEEHGICSIHLLKTNIKQLEEGILQNSQK